MGEIEGWYWKLKLLAWLVACLFSYASDMSDYFDLHACMT